MDKFEEIIIHSFFEMSLGDASEDSVKSAVDRYNREYRIKQRIQYLGEDNEGWDKLQDWLDREI